MRKLFLQFRTNTSAFGLNPRDAGREAAGILRALAERLERDGLAPDAYYALRDSSGMPVGSMGHEDEKAHV